MWKAFSEIGIEAIHTGPVKRAGGISGWQLHADVDGHFDRISTQIDPAFGTEERFRTDVRDRQLVRRHDHRRHRSRAHRKGRRLPARGDEVRRLLRASTTWSRSTHETGTSFPMSRPERTR